jgi:hypothetical protein
LEGIQVWSGCGSPFRLRDLNRTSPRIDPCCQALGDRLGTWHLALGTKRQARSHPSPPPHFATHMRKIVIIIGETNGNSSIWAFSAPRDRPTKVSRRPVPRLMARSIKLGPRGQTRRLGMNSSQGWRERSRPLSVTAAAGRGQPVGGWKFVCASAKTGVLAIAWSSKTRPIEESLESNWLALLGWRCSYLSHSKAQPASVVRCFLQVLHQEAQRPWFPLIHVAMWFLCS